MIFSKQLYRSPLEGEQAKQGRQPAVERWGVRTLLPALLAATLSSCVSVTTDDGFAPEASAERALADYIRLAFAYYEADDMAGARRHIDNILVLDGRNAEAQHALALVHAREGEAAEAEDAFRRALALDRSNSRARNNFAAFLFAQDRFADAHRQLQTVTADADYEGRAVAFENLGRSAMSLQRTEEAQSAFEQAIALNPGLYVSLLELARIHAGRGDWSAAAEYFRWYNAALEAYNLPASLRESPQ